MAPFVPITWLTRKFLLKTVIFLRKNGQRRSTTRKAPASQGPDGWCPVRSGRWCLSLGLSGARAPPRVEVPAFSPTHPVQNHSFSRFLKTQSNLCAKAENSEGTRESGGAGALALGRGWRHCRAREPDTGQVRA